MSSRAVLKAAVSESWGKEKPKGNMLYVLTSEAPKLKVQDLDAYYSKHPNPQKMPTLDSTKKPKKKGLNCSEEELHMLQKTLKDTFSRSILQIPVDDKKM